MPQVYSFETLSQLKGSSPLYGVIGYPVAHSLSPAMQEAAFETLGLPARYVRIEVSPGDLEKTVGQMRELPFAGWNCTIPYKLDMADLVDEQDPSARNLGGVNTVLNTRGHLKGYNTDGGGWVRAIREDFSLEVKDLRIMVLGTGGAGMAIACQAALEQCQRLVLVNRTRQKASELAETIWTKFMSDKFSREKPVNLPWELEALKEELPRIDLLVNASSVGLRPEDPAVLPVDILHAGLCVYDTIYKPTKLIDDATRIGARTANGLSMLLHQGALAFEIWTGQPAPLEAMRSALWKAAHPTPNPPPTADPAELRG